MRRIGWMSFVVAVLAFSLSACANRGAGGGEAAAAPAQQAPAQQAAPAKPAPPKAMAAPAGSKLAKVQVDMHPGQVLEIMGQATSQNTRVTGKDFIPYYHGSDGARQEWNYKGVGRVIMGTNRWSGKQKVIAVEYDPSEDGY